MPLLESSYLAPKFFRSALVQTLYSFYVRKVPSMPYKREKIITPDKDFLYCDWIFKDPRRLVILTHGIAGHSQTTYNRGMAKIFADKNWSVLAWNMRGRGSETVNWREKNYHLGFTEDLRFVIEHAIRQKHFQEIVLIGFSMGANIVLKYLGEEGDAINPAIKASIAFSAPIDAVSCGERIDHPSRRFYTNHILREIVNSTVAKVSLLAPLIDVDRLVKVKTWHEFDEIYTAPIYGFDSVLDYRRKASAKPFLSKIVVPSLLISAKDDPLLSAECFPQDESFRLNPFVFGEYPENGGHLGFVSFGEKGILWSEQRSLEFIESL